MRYKKIDNLIVFENGKIYKEMKNKCKLTGLTKSKNGYLYFSVYCLVCSNCIYPTIVYNNNYFISGLLHSSLDK